MMKSTVVVSFLFSLFFLSAAVSDQASSSVSCYTNDALTKSPYNQPVKTVTGLKALTVDLHGGKGDAFFHQMTMKDVQGLCKDDYPLLKVPSAVPRYESWGVRGTPSFE